MRMMNNGRTAVLSSLVLGCVTLMSSFFTSATEVSNDTVKHSETIKPFVAVYDMYRQGDRLGQGERRLERQANNQYSLSLESELKWLIFSDRRKETSVFSVQDEQVVPSSYQFNRSGTGSDDEINILFNKDNSLVINPKARKDAAPETWQLGWQDEMSLHAQIQLDLINGKKLFDYTVVTNNGKLRDYNFEVIGEELISTGFGRFKAVKIARIYDDKKFYAQHAWFIPELNFTLARLWRMKKGVEQYDLVINSYTVSE